MARKLNVSFYTRNGHRIKTTLDADHRLSATSFTETTLWTLILRGFFREGKSVFLLGKDIDRIVVE